MLLRYTAAHLPSTHKILILDSVLPLHTDVVERTFSGMNLAKDRKRNGVASDLRYDLLACSLIPKEIDALDAMRMWQKAEKRYEKN